MEEKSIESIKKATVKEVLIDNYNRHLVIYAGNLIEATFTAGRPPDEVVITLIQQSPNPQLPGIERKIKAKEAQINAKREVDKQDSILKVIQGLIVAEDKKETKFD